MLRFPSSLQKRRLKEQKHRLKQLLDQARAKTSIHPPFLFPGGSLGVLSPAQGTRRAAPSTGPNKARGLGCTGSRGSSWGSSQGSQCCPPPTPQHSPGQGPGWLRMGCTRKTAGSLPVSCPLVAPICDVTAMTSPHAGPGLCEIRALLSHVAPRATTAWLEAAHPVLVAVCLWQERFCQGSVRSFCLSGRALGRQNSWG